MVADERGKQDTAQQGGVFSFQLDQNEEMRARY